MSGEKKDLQEEEVSMEVPAEASAEVPMEVSMEVSMPERWYCDTDCRASNRACRGESGKDPAAKNLCPYFEDMLF